MASSGNFQYYSFVEKSFEGKKEEDVLSKIDFKIGSNSYRAIFYIVYGNFYSIEFTANMSDLLQTSVVDFN